MNLRCPILLAATLSVLAACELKKVDEPEAPAAPVSPAPAAPPVSAQPALPAPPAPPPTPAQHEVPAAFQGEWNATPADCGTGNNDSVLRIEPQQLRFYESTGRIVALDASNRDLRVTVELSGEGQTWTSERHFQLSADGTSLTDVSADGFVRSRCPG